MSVNGYTEKGSARVEYIGNYYNDPYIRGFSVTIFYVHRVIVANIVTSGVVVTLP